MSFQKAADLLRLAEMATSRYYGVSLAEIETEFGVDRRTAQRMTRMLEQTFPNYTTRTDDERRKYWRLDANGARLMLAQGVRDEELAALDMAARRAERDDAGHEVLALRSLKDRLLAAMPGPHARRVEADAEALLEAYGFASRPGPRTHSPTILLQTVAAALKGPHQLRVRYRKSDGSEGTERILEPHGLLLGTRRYLVARTAGGTGRMQHFRLDRMEQVRLEASSFARDPDFDLEVHAARAFGSYHDATEYGEVVWRFDARAAPVAREFVFHPGQQFTENTDGTLTVRFEAGGHLEMAWHLYQWGDAVEVIEPAALGRLVAGHRRTDFPALP